LIDSSVRITMRGFSGFDTSYAAVPSAPAIQASPLRSTCTSCVAMPVTAGMNWPAFFGFAGSRRSTIWIPRAVPARYAKRHFWMHEAVWPIPGSWGSGRPKIPGTPVSMNPFGMADLRTGARGFEMSMT
jgi:hypothetical protein